MSKQLSLEQVLQFQDQGYLIVEEVLPEQVLQSVRDEYEARLDELAGRFHASGKISSDYRHLPLEDRYIQILSEFPVLFDFLEITLPLVNEGMPAGLEIHTRPAIFDLLTHPRLLDVVERIIGPEIYSNPVQHLRIKPPESKVPDILKSNSYVGMTTWHQDQGALLDEADDTQLLTAWVAITDATEENGCMVCIPGSHRRDGGALKLHCPGKGITSENYIPEPLLAMSEVVTLPVRRGGVVLLNQYTEHAALPNKTDSIRWSFDLRYNPVGQPSGRPAFPGFVARSRAKPERALRDASAWAALWQEAYERILAGQQTEVIYNEARWAAHAGSEICA